MNFKYTYINLIFDEIELYFHPDMQRNYIFELTNMLNKEYIARVYGINIIFITHSPFILSDIPNQNIMYLKEGSPLEGNQRPQKSFGANIHDLLADAFFMNDGYMGEFAKQKIKDIIVWLNDDNRDINKKEYFKKNIEVIDEPVLRRKLSEMYSNITDENLELILLEKEIEMLEKRKKTIQNKTK